LRVEISGLLSPRTDPTPSIHIAVLTATVEVLGGRLDLQVGSDPHFEVPLEL
jgi:hypothetical protein